jgi:LysM repeat protein
MSSWPGAWRSIQIFCLSLVFCGCLPPAETQLDDEKDPNFIDGRNNQHALNYKGAIEAFERAVQSNPKNAAAHFELGLLYEERENDFTSAIYHYEKHLKHRPNSSHRIAVDQRVQRCKLELAKSVSFGVINAEVHRDMQKFTNEIATLKSNVVFLQTQLARRPPYITQYVTLRVTNFVSVPQKTETPQPQRPVQNTAQQQQRIPPPTATNQTKTAVAPATKTYTVRAGDTFSNIARRHRVSIAALQAANRGLDPRRLRANQVIVIPAK